MIPSLRNSLVIRHNSLRQSSVQELFPAVSLGRWEKEGVDGIDINLRLTHNRET